MHAAVERIEVLEGTGNMYQKAEAHLALARVHVALLGKKIARCSVASPEDTIAALGAAKQAYALFERMGSREGVEGTVRVAATVLMYNKVPPDEIEVAGGPEEVLRDVMNGRYSHSANALPRQKVPTNLEVKDVVPSSKVLDRG